MLIKNKFITLFSIILFLLSASLNAEEYNIVASEVEIDKNKEILIGKGSVRAIDSLGRIITADKITYEKSKEFLTAEGNVTINDIEGNILNTDKATVDKINEVIITYDNSELVLKEGYRLIAKKIIYNTEKKILSSNNNSILKDKDGNSIEVNNFQYLVENNLFSSIGKVKVIDSKNNNYFFKEIYIDTLKKEMVGSEVSVVLDQKNFGVSEESDPRFVANDIFMSENKSSLSKGVFTICKIRDDKCPPWSLKAKKIIHDRVKKTIYYERATLKFYDIPIFYFPKFFHPDPTVKRQSGFLAPFFTNSSNLGTGFALPYYWAINKDKDLTFTPKIYSNDNPLILNEYRQAYRNAFLILDTSYTEGYKNPTKTKTDGSRSHIFANLDINFNENKSYKSDLTLKVQQVSNDTYFRKHNINTKLVESEDTDLENEIKYSFSNADSYFNISANSFQNLRNKKKSDQYEFILPNILYGKTFFTEKFGSFNFESNAFHSNYETNKYKTFLTNDIIWSPSTNVTKKGFLNTIQGMIRNTNYETEKTNEYKDGGTIQEVSAVLANKISLPLKKDGINYSNLFSPNFMVRYAPAHMRNLSGKDEVLNYSNLYSLNKTSEIEDGLSAILGFDFKINKKELNGNESEKLSVSLGQVFSDEENMDIPSKSSLNQKTSDVVGNINYNFSEIGKIGYNFSLDHNLNDLNYNEVSTQLNFGKIKFNLDYLEQQNHIGDEHYVSPGVSLNFNDHNKLNFSTKKNFKTESTEFYDLAYQYAIDCLTAGLVYRREFYQDTDLEPKNTLMFTITFKPFTSVSSPAINP